MPARLIEPGSGAERTREIPLAKEDFLIGRGADCDLRLRVSAISRHHCLIRLHGGEAILSDLGSSNGTYVNGQRVRSQTHLHSGDEIRVGAYRFVVDLGDSPDLLEKIAKGADPMATTAKMRDADVRDKEKPL